MKPELKAIWDEVKANHAKLDDCPKHEFQPVPRYPDKPNNPMRDYVCSKCQGRIDAVRYAWYQRGLADAAKPT